MSLNAIQGLGEPNCMYSIVALIRAGEDADTCMKVITYALTFFVCLVASLTLVGLIPVCMGVQEYARQTAEQAFLDHQPIDRPLSPLPSESEIAALKEEIAELERSLAHVSAIAQSQPVLPTNAEVEKLKKILENATRRADTAEEKARSRLLLLKRVVRMTGLEFENWKKLNKQTKF